MNCQELTVCVTGAAGQIAYSFLPRLCSGVVFPGVNLNIRLLDIPQVVKVLEGVILELQDCDFPLIKSVLMLLFRFNMEINLNKCLKMLM